METKTPPGPDPQTLITALGILGTLATLARKVYKRMAQAKGESAPKVLGLESAVKLAYDVGATAAISLIGIDKGKITGTFEGENTSLSLLPGDYLLLRLPKPSARKRGITPHPNPNAKE